MSEMKTADYHKAWRNWLSVGMGHYGDFVNFVEQGTHPMSWDTKGQIHYLHPDTARRLKLLCGPHYRAIIKAWYAKQHQIT